MFPVRDAASQKRSHRNAFIAEDGGMNLRYVLCATAAATAVSTHAGDVSLGAAAGVPVMPRAGDVPEPRAAAAPRLRDVLRQPVGEAEGHAGWRLAPQERQRLREQVRGASDRPARPAQP